MKNKKNIIILVILLIIIAVIVATVLIVNKNSEEKAKQALIEYMNLINEKKYETMYEKVSSMNMSKEDYITRNKNIYEGIDSTNINIDIKEITKQDNIYKITYHQKMYTSAGEVQFDNIANIVKEDKEYKLQWSSRIIFPSLGETDKVRVEKIKSKRGSILDRNNNPLAEDGKISSVGIVPGKLGDNKDENINKISELTVVSVEYINESLSA